MKSRKGCLFGVGTLESKQENTSPHWILQFINNNTPHKQLISFTIKYGNKIPNWILMIEILCHSNANLQTYNRTNRAFKYLFVAIANVRLRSILGYNIENAQDRLIYKKGPFEAIENTLDNMRFMNNINNKIHRNYQERTGAHSSTQERQIISNIGHRERPINSQIRTHSPSDVVADSLIVLVLLLQRLFE